MSSPRLLLTLLLLASPLPLRASPLPLRASPLPLRAQHPPAAAALDTVRGCPASRPPTRHFVYFELQRERIADGAFLARPAIAGAQLKYTWRELEPDSGRYDFSALRHDLEFLQGHGKRLFVQLQDVSFVRDRVNVPDYLRRGARYHGGVAAQFDVPGGDERKAVIAGWVPRRWDPAVRGRFHALLAALGREFDGRIEGINLPETAVDLAQGGALQPQGFTPGAYREGVLETMAALRRAFPRSVAMLYGNFMPGEWLPFRDGGHLRAVYARAGQLRLAMGGPDLLPHRRGQMAHSYPLLRAHAAVAPTGIAVQWGNYDTVDPTLGRPPTVPELAVFASEYLCASYVFWSTQEPFFSRDLLPYLEGGG